MTWFVASVVSCIEVIEGTQSSFPIFEDFYLLEAGSQVELDKKILNIRRTIDAAGECNLHGKPARQFTVGVRKIRSIYNEPPLHIDMDQPGDGSELTHSYFEAKSKHEVELFAKGQVVNLTCVDDQDSEP